MDVKPLSTLAGVHRVLLLSLKDRADSLNRFTDITRLPKSLWRIGALLGRLFIQPCPTVLLMEAAGSPMPFHTALYISKAHRRPKLLMAQILFSVLAYRFAFSIALDSIEGKGTLIFLIAWTEELTVLDWPGVFPGFKQETDRGVCDLAADLAGPRACLPSHRGQVLVMWWSVAKLGCWQTIPDSEVYSKTE